MQAQFVKLLIYQFFFNPAKIAVAFYVYSANINVDYPAIQHHMLHRPKRDLFCLMKPVTHMHMDDSMAARVSHPITCINW